MTESKQASPHDRARLAGLSSRELALIFAFWTSLALLSVVGRMFDPRGDGLRRAVPVAPMVYPFVEAWIWALLTPAIFWLSSRTIGSGGRWVTQIPMLLLGGLVVAVSVDVLLDLIRFELFPTPRRRSSTFSPMRGVYRLRFLSQLMVYFAVLAAGFAREYFLRDRARETEAVALKAETASLQAQLANARLDALRMQINPHFLFNTLNAISALVERDPAGVRRMIARLSELLRRTLDSKGRDRVPLRDELAFVRRYLDIMEVRFQGRLRITTEYAAASLNALVPNFILQPIIENALEHGAGRTSDEALVTIRSQVLEDSLVIVIGDNGPGITEEPPSRGVGLANTRARLTELYGTRASFTLASAPGEGTRAEIRIPLQYADREPTDD